MTNENMQKEMIEYLQEKLTRFEEMLRKNEVSPNYYRESEINRAMDGLIACKEMVECLIGQPVNLQKDGKVTVGF